MASHTLQHKQAVGPGGWASRGDVRPLCVCLCVRLCLGESGWDGRSRKPCPRSSR